jgi:hypothetical protein
MERIEHSDVFGRVHILDVNKTLMPIQRMEVTKFREKTTGILIIGFCFLSFTCNSPTGPGTNAQPGSRNYTWTTDTLSPSAVFGPSVYHLRSIWGSSPTDVWTGGTLHNTQQYNLFHFDGKIWTGLKVQSDIWTIFGFASNDVWSGGEGNGGEIWHFDGHTWSRSLSYKPLNVNDAIIEDIYGTSPNDVYAVGMISPNPFYLNLQRGLILHYDGSSWKEVYTANYQSQFERVRVDRKGTVYLSGERYAYTASGDTELTDTQLLFQFRNGIVSQIYSDSSGNGIANIEKVGVKVYFILTSVSAVSHDMYIYDYMNNYLNTDGPFWQGNFEKLISINDPQFDGQVYGRGENDLFITLYDGIAHWNGTDVKRLLTFSNNFTFIPTPSIFEKEIFFCVSDGLNNVNMVVHGKLTE